MTEPAPPSPPRVVVFGSRSWANEGTIATRLAQLPVDWIITHGACPFDRWGRSADMLADRVARRLGRAVDPYPANWSVYGLAAGPRRNEFMAALPGVVLGIGFREQGKSNGTDGMCRLLLARGVPVECYGWGWA